jgi:hypothetical protein
MDFLIRRRSATVGGVRFTSPLMRCNKEGFFMKKINLFFAVSLFSVFSCTLDSDIYTNTNEISDTIGSLQPRVILLNNVSVKKQPDSSTCGITSVTIMSNYFNNTDYEVKDLIKRRNANGGASFDDMKKWLQLEMPEKNVVLKSKVSNEEMLRNIHASLDNNNPVLISFGAPNPYNKPFYDFHASVVYGINLDKEKITIANAYGFIEEISLVIFLNRMSFTEIDKYPLIQQTVLMRNEMDKNVYFLVN